jgi:hypothetical protein
MSFFGFSFSAGGERPSAACLALGDSLSVGGEPRVVLSKPEMRELFQFLMREARNFEDACCWHGCRNSGSLYRIRGISVRAVRFYCDRHATAVELAGFRVFPVDPAA